MIIPSKVDILWSYLLQTNRKVFPVSFLQCKLEVYELCKEMCDVYYNKDAYVFCHQVESLRKRQKPLSSKAAGRIGKYDQRPLSTTYGNWDCIMNLKEECK